MPRTTAWTRVLLGLIALLSGCTAVVGGSRNEDTPTPPSSSGAGSTLPNATAGAGTTGGNAPSETTSNAPIATPTLARLSVLQWANSVRDLLGLQSATDLDDALTKDAVVRFDNEADALFVSQALHDDLQTQAERLAAQISADTQAVSRLVPTDAPTDAAGKAKAFLQDFGRKAYRRPLTDAELQEYVTLFNQGPTLTTGMGAFEAGVRVTLEAFLQSPHFLYKTSFGSAAANGRARLTDYEIAANLSLTLTNHPPDGVLSTLADQGALKTAAPLREQAERLLKTDAGQSAVDRFYFQYFGLGQYDTLQKDAAVAPDFKDGTGPLLHTEAAQLLRYLFEQNKGLGDIFTSPVGFVNAPVAKLYGLSGTFNDQEWTQVSFDAEQRPGVLTRLGFLAYFAHQGLQDTIHRGAAINSRVLCTVMSPPANLEIPPLPAQDPNRTNRQLVADFTETCGAGCHKPFINPAGFALENFDGLGRYRTTENGKPIDASGAYSFSEGTKSFGNVAQFMATLAQSGQAHRCYTWKWAASLYGRMPRRADENAASALATRSIGEHLSSREVVLALVSDDAFVTRMEDTQ